MKTVSLVLFICVSVAMIVITHDRTFYRIVRSGDYTVESKKGPFSKWERVKWVTFWGGEVPYSFSSLEGAKWLIVDLKAPESTVVGYY